ncbi:hypothetical protein A3K34_02735 [candidate division WWE3 bacterium RIFOXYC1_FULL_40_10]|uniref:Probable peptidoglycan glycosyltransferase FtsW n=1 Tax=candidate division WWE3 bacterium RIFOXYA2_FULL_46_9 TaxID=1802636 RepID=A0A1F4W308_UNCKA|nr:MAG: hypothetical protein A3K58_02735 [candidate division WWE3 bacterium RIFOXYB1_FULL_40_22]OGC61762.1 MAG: hypothetical protein A3K37_02735 [candidate division WWE3 bacterium RIFOXYA1_FULL_40_11]OGC63745.1 MAG: hypothetical protein A2264_05225 [candidate division WWE3 bacterium RIFOXYA2_FULL_46_9]OGC65188.1 MAG: hypothetical protein A2326_02415 [candidate division WWE3 bacterium RIFOXYB2_FULL_41_6]OGC66145.1 MAG: hypothetical protein A3K34_02735 [candidate division WWE3 bacterium RIFOXYC1_
MKVTKPASIPLLTYLLLAVGVIFMASSSQIYSQEVYGVPYHLLLLQIGWIPVGSAFFWYFYKIRLEKLDKIAYLTFVLGIGFLLILAIAGLMPCEWNIPFAPCIKGARRWLFINPSPLPAIPFIGVLGFQPSEFMKLGLIMYLSVQLSKLIKRREEGFWVYLLITGLVSFLVMLQPNMSTAVILFLIGSVVYFVSGQSLKKFAYVIPVALILGLIFIFAYSYRLDRFKDFIAGEGSEDYHVRQILISLGSGGVTGVGYGQSKQKYSYLPEVAADSIFAVIGEEFGLVGTLSLISLFGYLLFKGFTLSLQANDVLERVLAAGITFWIGLQVFINVAAMVRLIPLTGIPLPLVSYGGSSMVFTMAGLGILAGIEKRKV